jgi:hypothetical protein
MDEQWLLTAIPTGGKIPERHPDLGKIISFLSGAKTSVPSTTKPWVAGSSPALGLRMT